MRRSLADTSFRMLLEAAPDAMVVTDNRGLITLVNSQTERLFGFTRDELIGESVDRLVPARFRAQHPAHRQHYFHSPRPRPMGVGLSLSGSRKDGTEFPVEISLSPVETEEGALVIAAIRDISERMKLEEVRAEIAERTRAESEMRRLNEALERRVAERTAELAASNRELEGFTYSVSHDLRAPLRQIDGFGRLLIEELGDDLPEKARHYLTRIRTSTQEMGRLVDDLLNFARLGRQGVRARPTDMTALAREVIASLAADQGARQVDWQVADLPTLSVDPGLMRVVFDNLLSNALKYTRPRERALIEVTAGTRDGRPMIAVRDNGVGFDMRYADKLFGVFQRLHRADQFEGTGVGLATVQRIVQKHGGEIWASSAPDAGASFAFTVPAIHGDGVASGVPGIVAG
jgi:PAS domain S-box-containing protein